MHSYLPHGHAGARTEETFHFASPLSHTHAHAHPQQQYDETWASIGSSSYNFQFEFSQKHMNNEYPSFQSHQTLYNTTSQFPDYSTHTNYPVWSTPIESYQNQQYDSPGGHFGGNMSEASSDYAISPELTRQHVTVDHARYFSPPAESQFSQQSWSTESPFILTPAGTPVNVQTPSVAMEELEFQGGLEYQVAPQEENAVVHMSMNVPEELELSDSIATLTTSMHGATNSAARSHSGSDSSVSTPAHDNDSDSDFDPRGKPSRVSLATRNTAGRHHRRTSSTSYPTLDINNRVHKSPVLRSNAPKDRAKTKSPPQLNATSDTNSNSKLPRSFPCTFHAFGCYSTFANKNEWKRHITSQHLQLGFYRCDLGACNPDYVAQSQQHSHGSGSGNKGKSYNKRRSSSNTTSGRHSISESPEWTRTYNEFNRKDLFTQHCRRMHGPLRHLQDETTATNQAINTRLRAQGRKISVSGKVMATKEDEIRFEEELELIRARCWTVQRHAPERSSCGFCRKLFEASAHVAAGDGEGKAEERAWEERMEHLGKHYERDGCLPESEGVDDDLLEWGLNQHILMRVDSVRAGAWLVDYELPGGVNGVVEREGEELRRGGLRKRGPRRRRNDANLAVASTTSAATGGFVKMESAVDESDIDAMADDD